jgi:hypothetical protein
MKFHAAYHPKAYLTVRQKPSDLTGRRGKTYTLVSECLHERGPGQTEDEVKSPGRRGCKGHANLSDVEREGFCAIREGDRACAGRVDDHEEVDARCDAGETDPVGLDEEAEAGEEQEYTHEREGGEEEVSSPERVDGLDGRDGDYDGWISTASETPNSGDTMGAHRAS